MLVGVQPSRSLDLMDETEEFDDMEEELLVEEMEDVRRWPCFLVLCDGRGAKYGASRAEPGILEVSVAMGTS